MSLAVVFPSSQPSLASLDAAVGVAVFVIMVALYQAFSPDAAVSARARSLARHRRESRTDRAPGKGSPVWRDCVVAARAVLERLKLTEGDKTRKTTDFLARGGWRTPEALTVFLGMRLVSPIVLGVVAYSLAPVVLHHIALYKHILIAVAGIGAGAFAPTLFVKNAGDNRGKAIQKALPDALDLFVICAEAGLSLDAAIARVAREIGPAAPELADELSMTAIELRFMPNRRDALLNLHKRIPTPAIRNLVTTLAQTERYGTPLAQSLRVLARESRDTRMMKAEEKAARLPAILTVPMILFILPPLFVVLLGPPIIQVMATLPKP